MWRMWLLLPSTSTTTAPMVWWKQPFAPALVSLYCSTVHAPVVMTSLAWSPTFVATGFSAILVCPRMAEAVPLTVSQPWSGLAAVGWTLMSASTTRPLAILVRSWMMYGTRRESHHSSLPPSSRLVGFLYRIGITISLAPLTEQ